MTDVLEGLPPDALAKIGSIPEDRLVEMICRASPAAWAQHRRGFRNAPVHLEWYGLLTTQTRLALVAPRDHAKTECVTVNQTAWRSLMHPGTWTYVFAASGDLARALKSRIDEAIAEVEPWMVPSVSTGRKYGVKNSTETRYRNGSRVTVAGAGKAVRGAHPDVIIGDDVLEEDKTLTAAQRDRTSRWWHGTVGGMAHPGTVRVLPDRRKVRMAPTRIFLVGTPFHSSDLLMSMRTNDLYHFRRYAAEYEPKDLVPGTLAVEVH